ncbi:MAG: hypothetical protein PHP93_00065 [Kiritimatiellales bacterium]|nr:hypothetical protein [Kiritimatiellales bacterium]
MSAKNDIMHFALLEAAKANLSSERKNELFQAALALMLKSERAEIARECAQRFKSPYDIPFPKTAEEGAFYDECQKELNSEYAEKNNEHTRRGRKVLQGSSQAGKMISSAFSKKYLAIVEDMKAYHAKSSYVSFTKALTDCAERHNVSLRAAKTHIKKSEQTWW